MMGLKRTLFPEHSAVIIPGDSLLTSTTQRIGKPAHDRRKRKRNATMTIKVVEGDSLANVLLGKENTMNVKTGKGSRQRKEGNPSILMGLDAKENTNNKNEGRQRTRQQKVVPGQNCANKSIKAQKVGSVLVSFDMNNKLGSSSRTSSEIASKRGRPARASKKRTAKAKIKTKAKATANAKIKAKAKHEKRINQNNTITKRVCLKESVPNGDSLMACLAESSKPLVESVLVEAEFKQEQTKSRGERRKRIEKRSTKDRSRVAKSTDASDPRKKSQISSKRTTAVARKVSGLGAFVGILGEGDARFVSPLESDLKTKSLMSVKNQEKKASKQESSKNFDTVSDTPALGEVPSVIIISLAQQNEQLQHGLSPETISTAETQSKVEIEPIKNEIRTEPLYIEGRQSKENEKKRFHQKFSVGTKFQKNFKFHGWFSGKVVGFDSETGFYKVRYEDGDTEELEQNELEKWNLQLDASEGAKSDKKLQGSIVNQQPNVAVEQSAPLRRSRQRSGESTEAVDNAQSNITNNRSLRRSRRRKSQPVRLIDDEQAVQSTGRKKNKRTEKSSKIETKQSSSIEDPTSESDNDRENINNDEPKVPLIQNRSSSPSNHDRGSDDKQHFDDALKAVMPIEDIHSRSNHDSDQMQDDIFNSTPMKKLFTKRLSNASESSATNRGREKSGKAERRSRRKSIEPERYGYDGESATKSARKSAKSESATKSSKKNAKSDSETKSSKKKDSATKSSKKNPKSAIKKSKRKTKRSLTAKKRVRISIEPPGVTNFDSDEEPKEYDQWTKADLRRLHRAHRAVDPTSFSFWEDVSEILGNRSAFECRHKWFSLAKTPEPKKSKKKKKENKGKNTTSNVRTSDDDIFNSTPMRSAFAIGESIDIADTAFEELGELSKINVGSAIKIDRPDENDEEQPSNHESACPQGYKTYLQKMGRIMRQKDTRKRQKCELTDEPHFAVGKKLAERIEEGDVQVKGRLSPGGTLRVDTFGYSDTEDYLDYADDETQ